VTDIETLLTNATASDYGTKNRARQELRRLLKEAELTERAGAMLEDIVVQKTVEVANLKGQIEQQSHHVCPPPVVYGQGSMGRAWHEGHVAPPGSQNPYWGEGGNATLSPGALAHSAPGCSNFSDGDITVGLRLNVTCPVCRREMP
jgi:hypothetical protein